MFAVLSEEPGRGGQLAEPESRPGTRPNYRVQATTAYSGSGADAVSRA